MYKQLQTIQLLLMLAYDITGIQHYYIILRFSVFSTFVFHLMHPAYHSSESVSGPSDKHLTALFVLVEPVPPGLPSPAMTFWYFFDYLGLQALLVHVHEHC